MFNTIVDSTALYDQYANEYFIDKIPTGPQPTFRGVKDVSLISTCRALLYPRLGDVEKVSILASRVENDENTLNVIDRELQVFDKHDLPPTFEIIIVPRDEMPIVTEVFAQHNQWREIEKVRLFFAQTFSCCAYVRDELKVSILIMEAQKTLNATVQCYHAAQCAILTANPWFFDPINDKDSITERDMALITALSTGNYTHYMELLEQYSEEFNFKAEIIRKQLEKFERAIETARLSNLQYTLSDTRSRIENLMSEISSLIRNENETQALLAALQLGLAEKGSQFTVRDYFDSHPNTRITKIISEDRIQFSISTYLDDWDEDLMEVAIHNHRSVMFDYVSSYNHEEMEMLYTAIFEKRTIKIPMIGLFEMHSTGKLKGIDGHSEDLPNEYMPNPHIFFYHCLGGYETDIIQAMRKEDRLYALEIANVSAGNVNFGDNTVMHRWSSWMFDQNCDGRKCFELPDGSRVTITEAMEWLREEGTDE